MKTPARTGKSLWVSAAGLLAALPSLLVSCCGAGCAGTCGIACLAPVASLLGVSIAGILGSPAWKALQSILIAVSAVSFTVAYYALYKRPTPGAACSGRDCGGPVANVKTTPAQVAKFFFWVSLVIGVASLLHPVVSGFSRQTGNRTTTEKVHAQCTETKGKSVADGCGFACTGCAQDGEGVTPPDESNREQVQPPRSKRGAGAPCPCAGREWRGRAPISALTHGGPSADLPDGARSPYNGHPR